ncbi:MAG: S41 family peptidase, partial [Bacteroidia bacterium]
TGEYGGIGAIIRQKDDYIVIVEPYEGSPAQKADIRAGDVIIEVNGKNIKGKNSSDVSKILKGQANSEVTLLIEREGEKNRIEKKLMRQEIKVNNVPYYSMLKDDVGYIKLTGFTETASREVKDAFVDLKSKGMKKLIFDLRDNGGGLLKEAVNIVNFFVPKGSDVVSTRGKIKEWDKVHKALNSPLDLDIPLVVIINANSASASEIVAGAIQDFDRGVVIGERSFGKGLVQQTRPLSYNAQLKVTVAKYYTPSGRCIQEKKYANDVTTTSFNDTTKIFYTKKGRPIKSNAGVEPDIIFKNEIPLNIKQIFAEKELFFYINHVFKNYQNSSDSVQFLKKEEEKLINFLSSNLHLIHHLADFELMRFEEKMREKNSNIVYSKEILSLQQKLMNEKRQLLKKYKNEITEELLAQLIKRKYGKWYEEFFRIKNDKILNQKPA